MGSFLSPGVYIREIDKSEYAPQIATTIFGVVGVANKGPLHVPTAISSEPELIDTFGPPPNLQGGSNERQVISFTGTPTSGNLYFSFNGSALTTALAYTTSLAAGTVQTKLETITALSGNVTVTGPDGGPYTVEFTNDQSQRPQDAFVVTNTLNNNATVVVSRITPGTTAPADYGMHAALMYLRAGRQLVFVRTCQTISDAWQATTAKTPDPVFNAESGGLMWDDTTPYGLQLQAKSPGDWGDDLEIRFVKLEGAQNAKQKITLTPGSDQSAKNFKLSYKGNSTADIAFTDVAATLATTVQTRLNTLIGASAVTVTGSGGGVAASGTTAVVLTVEFTGDQGVGVQGTGTAASQGFLEQPLFVEVAGSTPFTSCTVTISTTQTGRNMGTNVYRMDVIATVDNSGSRAVVESYNRVMLVNDQSALQTYNAHYLIDAITVGVANAYAKSNYVTFTDPDGIAIDVPATLTDVTYELATTADGSTGVLYELDGGYSALNTNAGTPGDFTAAYVGTEVDAVYGTTGLQCFANPQRLDMNLIAVPGVTDADVLNELVNVCVTRQDCMCLLDTPRGLTWSEAVAWHNKEGDYFTVGYKPNSSFAALYWPWVETFDPYNHQAVTLPPSCVVAAQYAISDTLAAPWFAPAGFKRGHIMTVTGLESSTPSQGALDTMYSGGNCVNPIIDFRQDGVTIMGQRTTQRRPTALDRVNVRRLLLYIEKLVATSVRYLLFDPNDDQTQAEFVALITPILRQIKYGRGLYDFKVICDSTTNPPSIVDRNELKGVILIKPTKAAEQISIDFTLLSTGAEFNIPGEVFTA